jgi:hypothetical protein
LGHDRVETPTGTPITSVEEFAEFFDGKFARVTATPTGD